MAKKMVLRLKSKFSFLKFKKEIDLLVRWCDSSSQRKRFLKKKGIYVISRVAMSTFTE